MNDTIQKILIGISSIIIGFILPFVTNIWNKFIKSKRIKSALLAEFMSIQKKMDAKLKWVGRDVSKYINQVDEKKIVNYKNKKLFLGEKEEFKMKCVYWDEKYCEIVEILSDRQFSDFYEMHELILKFVEKFAQMKYAFETNYGDPKKMAEACFEELLEFNRKLEEKLIKKTNLIT